MMIVRLPILLLTWFACSSFSLDELKNIQLAGYRGRVSLKKVLITVAVGIVCALSIFIVDMFARGYSVSIYCVFTALGAIYALIRYGNLRTRFKFTKRGTRLFLAVSAVGYACTAAIVFCVERIDIVIYACIALLALSAVITEGVSYAVYPLEVVNNKRYVDRAKRMLDGIPTIKIGITGSYGKTSCKCILAEMLKSRYTVIKTPGNYNTPMGIVKTVNEYAGSREFSAKGIKPIVFIAEMGARHKGDINELVRFVEPDHAIVTGVCAQHVESLGSIGAIYAEKSALAGYVRAKGGTVVYNADNPYTAKMAREYGGLTAGFTDGDYRAKALKMGVYGLKFRLNDRHGEDASFATELIGRHNALNIAMCFALANTLGVTLDEATAAVKGLKPVPHRLELKRLDGVTVIDDGYNANFDGVLSALETLSYFDGRKVVYAQGVVELGKLQKKVNVDVGRAVAAVADVVILSGVNADYIESGLADGGYRGKIYRFDTIKEATENLPSILISGDVVLFQNDLP